MNKNEWISNKIRILEHENKGRSHQENIAIAFSLYNKEHGMQQGGQWWNTFTNPNFDIQAQTMSPQQNFAPQTTGMNTQGSLGSISQRPQLEPLTQITPQGLQQFTTPPVQGLTTPDTTEISKSYLQSQPKDFTWESTQKPKQVTGDEWQRYKLANIYGSGLGTSEALAMTGKYAGEGNTGMAIGAGALSALKGTRDFLTGFGAGKTNKRTYEDYLKSLEKDQPYNYLSETPLQATAQQGGTMNPNQFMSYQTSMQPVYNKADMEEQGLSQLEYYKMLMQSAQTPFVNPPQQPDLSQQVYQESFIPNKDLTANDYLTDQTIMQQGGIHIAKSHEGLFTEQAHKAGYKDVQAFAHHVMSHKDKYDSATVKRANFAINATKFQHQQGGYTEDQTQQNSTSASSSDVTNAQMMTGAFVTDQPNATTNIEKNEQVKNSQTGEIQKAVGDTHKDGGIDVNLPQGSQVLSDYTKINKEEAKKFAKDYNVNVSTKDTYATVQDKINNKIGWTKAVKEEEDLIKKIEDVKNGSKDENTLNINMKFLQDKYKELNARKAGIQQEQKAAFDNLFATQESHAKKGNGELLNEDGTPMQVKKYGGEVYDLANKYNVHPDRVYEMMQEGGSSGQPQEGAVQPQRQDMQSQVVQMLQNGSSPEQVVELLVSNNVPQEDAIRIVQAITSGQQAEMQAPPLETAQQGITTGKPPLINSTLLANFTQQPADVTWLPYTPQDIASNPIWSKENYATKWKPLVEQTMANPESAKKVEDWLLSNKDKFSKNILSQIESLKGEERSKRIAKLATDTKPGLFHNAVLQGIQQIQPEVKATPEAPIRQVVEGQNQPITKMGLPVLPSPYILPPSNLQPVGKWDISLGRVEPSKITAEPTIAALSQQQLAGQRSNLQNLSPEAAASANAMLQATVGAQTNQALGQTEEANRQAIYASELQNMQQADKEKITQAGINEAYQTKMYNAMNNTERDWRNYFNQKSGQDMQNYKDVQGMQLLNAMSPDYQYTGSDVVFSNRPYETAQQRSDREYQQEMLKWYKGLTDKQKAEMQKKSTS